MTARGIDPVIIVRLFEPIAEQPLSSPFHSLQSRPERASLRTRWPESPLATRLGRSIVRALSCALLVARLDFPIHGGGGGLVSSAVFKTVQPG